MPRMEMVLYHLGDQVEYYKAFHLEVNQFIPSVLQVGGLQCSMFPSEGGQQ